MDTDCKILMTRYDTAIRGLEKLMSQISHRAGYWQLLPASFPKGQSLIARDGTQQFSTFRMAVNSVVKSVMLQLKMSLFKLSVKTK